MGIVKTVADPRGEEVMSPLGLCENKSKKDGKMVILWSIRQDFMFIGPPLPVIEFTTE